MRRGLIVTVVMALLGWGPSGHHPRAHAAGSCDAATELCITIDTTHTKGPAALRAQGFLNGIFAGAPNINTSLVGALKPQQWRMAANDSYWNGSKGAFGGAMTWILREEWAAAHGNSHEPPLSEYVACQPSAPLRQDALCGYETFVANLVQKFNSTGHHIDYWDILNEPDIGRADTPECTSYDPCNNQTYLMEIAHAARVIHSVDPTAKVVVPSTTLFRPSQTVGAIGPVAFQLDLTTVLDYMVQNNVKIDAISWHELNTAYYNDTRVISPRSVVEHVAVARQLIAARPSLGPIEIHVNEYSGPLHEGLPGWEAGWIGALEDANVDRANRSCWDVPDPSGVTVPGCYGTPPGSQNNATLDQLFNLDGSTRAVYWVHRFYADMTGTRVTATVAAPTVPHQPDTVEDLPIFRQDPTDGSFFASAFATRDDTTSTVRGLIGRHYSCTKDLVHPCATSGDADEGDRPVLAPLHTVANVTWPYAAGNVRVTVNKIPNVTFGSIAGPTAVSSVVLAATSGGTLAVDLGQVADTEAFTLTLAPA